MLSSASPHHTCIVRALKADEPAVYQPQDLPHGSVYSLDSHHSHFVLVEEDPKRPGATSEMRVKLLKHISLQRTGYGGKSPLGHRWEPELDSQSFTQASIMISEFRMIKC